MRRAGFAVLTASMMAAACGRIVTLPKTTAVGGGLVPAGNMFIRFRVLGTLDFQTLHYLVVFNTSGNGLTPYATDALNLTYLNYTFILVFGGTVAAGAAYSLLQVINTGVSGGGAGSITTVQVGIAPQFITSFNPNSSGSGNEFTFTFNRNLLTPIATASPTPAPSPSATPNPIPTLASGVSSLWAINCFSASAANNTPIDTISPVNGISDTTFSSFVINTLQPFDVPVNKPTSGIVQVANINAQLTAVEIINTP